jgi:capsular exopolysaccharide synthesis family protein
MADQDFIELRWILVVTRRWWWLIIGLALLAASIAYLVTKVRPPVYESSAMLLVNPSKSSTTSQYNELMAGAQLALTYSQLLKDRPVLETVISDLGLKRSVGELSSQITAEPVRNLQLIKLTVSDSDPEQAALIANTLAKAFAKRVEELSAKRYAGEIQNAKDRMQVLQAQMKDFQAQIDTLRSQKITKDVILADRQTSLTTLQSDYQSLKNSYQNLQLSISEAAGKAYIVEPVQAQRGIPKGSNSATVVVSVGQAQSLGENSRSGDPVAEIYGQLMKKTSLLQGVINKLGLSETTDQLSSRISFEVIPGTQLVRFTFQDDDEFRAQLILQSLVDSFIVQVKTLLTEPYSDQLDGIQKQLKIVEGTISSNQNEIGQLTSEIAQMVADLDGLETDLAAVRSDYRESVQNYEQIRTTAVQESDAVIVTEPAEAPKLPSQNRIFFVGIAAFLGLVLGTGLAFFLMHVDSKIRTGQDVRSSTNLPILSSIGRITGKEKGLVMNSAPDSGVAEDFRQLSNIIRLISENASVKTLMVTSPVPTEGKSLIISNLAIGLTGMGLRIVLVDADLRRPRLHSLFELNQDDGLSNSLDKGNTNGSLQATGIGELRVLTSGIIPTNPAELLSSSHLANLLEELKNNTDLILLDCPPVLLASDASILASKVDGVLLVLRAGSSESKSAKEALEALEQVKAKLVGIVLNSVPNQKRGYYYRYRYHKA